MKEDNLDYIPLDKDFIQTVEDFFFCIIGYIHPPKRISSYLKYIPSNSGKWKLKNQNLKRVLPYYSAQAVLDTLQWLENNYPQYLFYDRNSDMVFSAVPFRFIKNYYSTRQKMREILALSKLDSLQNKLILLISTISRLSDVPLDAFGVTGSILLNIHNPDFSDLDVTIHGYENSLKIRQTMKDIFEKGHPELSPLDEKEAERWQKDKAKRFGMSQDEAKLLFKRKWNMGVFNETRFSIHPIRNLNEIEEKYDDKAFIQKGRIEIQAKIIDSQALFLPLKYRITKVEILKGEKVENIQEIVSYEGLFDTAVEKNEFVKAKGQLELVKDNKRKIEYYRLVIGSKQGNSEEYILKI